MRAPATSTEMTSWLSSSHTAAFRAFSQGYHFVPHFLLQPATPTQQCKTLSTHNHLHMQYNSNIESAVSHSAWQCCDGDAIATCSRRSHMLLQPQPPHVCPTIHTPSPARTRCASAAISRTRAAAFVNSQSDIVSDRGELTATTMGWNSGV